MLEEITFLEMEKIKRSGIAKIMQVTDSLSINLAVNSATTTGNSTYRSLVKVSENMFAVVALLKSASATEATITVVEIDKDGKLTSKSPVSIFYNTRGASISTTQFVSEDNTGKIFGFGNNAYPNYSSATFGYFYARVDADGNIQDKGYRADSNYHRYNVQSGGMISNDKKGFFGIYESYYSGDGKVRQIKLDYSSNTPSLYVRNPGSDTGTNYGIRLIGQRNITQADIDIIGFNQFRFNSTSYRIRAFNKAGSYTDFTAPAGSWSAHHVGFILSSGKILTMSDRDKSYVYSSYNSREEVDVGGIRSLVRRGDWSRAITTNVGVDTWVNIYKGEAVVYRIDPNNYKIEVLDNKILPVHSDSSISSYKIGGENDEFIISIDGDSGSSESVTVHRHNLKIN